MGATHGKLAAVYLWNGTASDLAAEACTESTNEAQITDTDKRLLNPGCTDLVFTDTGGKTVTQIQYLLGKAIFNGNVTTVTVTGTGAYIAAANITKVGYLYEWGLEFSLDTDEITAFQDQWKSFIVGQASITGSATGYFVGTTWWTALSYLADATKAYYLLELFTYDPDDDETGDHFTLWAVINGLSIGAGITGHVSEEISFQGHGMPVFTANA
jgi:hypothetical protein